MRHFILGSVLPALLAVLLFVGAFRFVFLPELERVILEKKREMIRELTVSAWNILARFEHDERSGALTRAEAQARAVDQIRNLHYGAEMKDYFWINDEHPRMVIHPYRPDLNGRDLSEIKDPEGKRLFVAFVETVRAHGAGFVAYRWQWKDDPGRIVPKLSFVKGFKPWGWIIGTGVYIDDVRTEIRAVTGKLYAASAAILALVALLVAWILSGHYRSETLRRAAEARLAASEERHRLLAESSGEYILLSFDGEPLFANPALLALLRYAPEEMAALDYAAIVPPTADERARGRSHPATLLAGGAVPARFETHLVDRDGKSHRVAASVCRVERPGRRGFSLIATPVDAAAKRHLALDELVDGMQRALLHYERPVSSLPPRAAVALPPEATVAEALAATGDGAADLVVRAGDAAPLACLDRTALLEAALGPGSPDRALATLAPPSPPAPLDPAAPLLDALLALDRTGGRPLPVLAGSTLVGTVAARDLALLERTAPAALLRSLETAEDGEALARSGALLPEIVAALVENGARTRHITRVIATAADTTLERAVDLALARTGPMPAPFCILVMGSEGRREQTLRTDQDNALLFADPPPDARAAWGERFAALGAEINRLLAEAGYARCEGGVMAGNPEWCLPLSEWKARFSAWVATLEAVDLLRAKIFFDFRAGAGDATLAAALSRHLAELLADAPRFFLLLASNVLTLEPPLGLFGGFVLEERDGARDRLDLKRAMSPVVDFARIYALRHGIAERGTFDRLDRLHAAGVLQDKSRDEILQAYGHLMRLRLEHQVRLHRGGETPDNLVRPADLTGSDRRLLKEIFTRIRQFQMRLSYDFTGMPRG